MTSATTRTACPNGVGANGENYWDGIAVAAHEQVTAQRLWPDVIEVFDDKEGYSTGTAQTVKEFTGTYEYKWKLGLLSRMEYRHDWSDTPFFHTESGMTNAQSTASAAIIWVFTPKR